MSKFKDKIEEVAKVTPNKSFSRKLFKELMTDYLNDIDHEYDEYKNRGNAVEVVTKYPVKEFRLMIKKFLIDIGLEQNEAENIYNSYDFSRINVEPFYDFMNDFIYWYMKTGRKYRISDREDTVAALYLKSKAPLPKLNSKGQTVEVDLYQSIATESPAPKWKKKVTDLDGTIKVMELIRKS